LWPKKELSHAREHISRNSEVKTTVVILTYSACSKTKNNGEEEEGKDLAALAR
jgi:hypothetical protein